MTSNLGSGSSSNDIIEKVKKFFKPEFVNRLDGIIVFNSLNKEMMKQIVDHQLNEMAKRLETKELSVTITEGAKKHLLEVGFDEVYGARPLKRVINELIVDEIALQLLEGKIKEKDKIAVDYSNKKIVIEKKSVN